MDAHKTDRHSFSTRDRQSNANEVSATTGGLLAGCDKNRISGIKISGIIVEWGEKSETSS